MSYIIVGILALVLGGIVVYLFQKRKGKRQVKEEATILLERIRTVCKLVTVEGDFTEILDHQEKKSIFFNLIPQNKRALLIVRAKALVGFDLTKATIDLDSDNRRLTISNFPHPEIISVETDIKYYDIKQSAFNKFTPADYTELNRQATIKIRTQVNNSELPNIAKKQGLETIKIIQGITDAVGWQLAIQDDKDEQKQIEK